MKIKGYDFTIGADPEIFMALDNKFTCAHNVIPGTKLEPFKVKNGAVQVDGMALEFNIDPSENLEQFQNNLGMVQEQLLAMLPPRCSFLNTASAEFDLDFYEKVPQEAKILGCDPDYNAYTMDVNPKPKQDTLMRTAGGHVHIGGFPSLYPEDPEHMKISGRLSKIIDETVGIYSVLWDRDDRRRSMYGKAGSFRPKGYGMEYRSLSNAWIFNRNLVSFVFNGVVEAIDKFFDKGYTPNPECRSIIDGSLRDHPLLNSPTGRMVKEMI